jgi:hypothetical protein
MDRVEADSSNEYFTRHTQYKIAQGTGFYERNELPHFRSLFSGPCLHGLSVPFFLYPHFLPLSSTCNLSGLPSPKNSLQQEVNFDSQADMLRQNSSQANLQANKVLHSLGNEYHCLELNKLMTTRWLWL